MTSRHPAASLLAASLLALPFALNAAVPEAYYTGADTSSATNLRSTVHTAIKAGHNNIGYTAVWDALHVTDVDPLDSNNVILIYTAQVRAGDTAECHSTPCEDGDAMTGLWTREHTFCQSKFNSAEPMQSDLHHIFPIDQDVNGARSDNPYKDVPSPTYSAGGSEGDANNWEVRADERGDIARALFYMDVRYEGDSPEPNLRLVDTVPGGTGSGEMGYLATLLAWSAADPPDAAEVTRNQRAYDFQKNSNPFVDHPEWVGIVYGTTTVANSNTLATSTVDRAAPTGTKGSTTSMLSFNATASAAEWDIATLTLAQAGTATDSDLSAVKVYQERDNDGTVDEAEYLVGTGTFSGGVATITMTPPVRVKTTAVNLLVRVTISGAATTGHTIVLNATGATHSAIGGNDTDPVFAPSGSTATTIQGNGSTGTVFISEYVEGSSNNKAVEIFNGTSSTIDFSVSPYWVKIYFNGATTSANRIQLTGTVGPGDTHVLANNLAVLGMTPDQTSSNLTFNGDDAVTLENDGLAATGTVYDSIGQIGVDPGTEWVVGGVSTLNHTLRRKPRIVTGDTNASDTFDPSIEWDVFAQDTFGGLDTHTANPAPSVGATTASILEDVIGTVNVAFTDTDAAATGTYTISTASVSSGALTAPVVTSPALGDYNVAFTYTPEPDYFGAVTFDFTVNDGIGPVTQNGASFSVASVNDPPTITAIGTQNILQNGTTGALNFTAGDVDDVVASLINYGTSDNQTLLPNANITFAGGTDALRDVTITPAAGQSGSCMVTVGVLDDDGDSGETVFQLNVAASAGVGDWTILE